MKPINLKTKIFLDSGDPEETAQAVKLLGFLDGQTTNPTLISRNPKVKEKFIEGVRFTGEELLEVYRSVVIEISKIIPAGFISIEVYADKNTKANEMIKQAREMYTWIPNAYIKLPSSKEGLTALEELAKAGMRINMTLCFSQSQAAAIYAATREALPGQVIVSPFEGRLDDIGEDGLALIQNIVRMYKKGDGHVTLLSASIRDLLHLKNVIALGTDIATAPFSVLKEWAIEGMTTFEPGAIRHPNNLKPIEYEELDLNLPWRSFNLEHQLTDKGMEKFLADWKSLIRG